MHTLLPVYRFPTLTFLIDDSQSFLDSLAFQLGAQVATKAFVDPQAAIAALREAHREFATRRHDAVQVGYDEESDSMERRSAFINLDRIYHRVTDRQRFGFPAVIVVDYAMPQMNGVEFCEAIRDLPCRKILLTGQADDKLAVDAFNRKLIDRFVKKNDLHALGQLEAEIVKLQKTLFDEQTRTLSDLLSRHSHAFLSDPAIEALVGELCSRYRFVEHYLFPNPAGILFFDARGKATLMVIETEASLKAQLEVAEDQGAPAGLVNGLRELRLIPFFSDTGGMYLDTIGDNWLSYCLPPQVCRGKRDYYWALFELPRHYLRRPVYSYGEFLRDHAADA